MKLEQQFLVEEVPRDIRLVDYFPLLFPFFLNAVVQFCPLVYINGRL